MEEEIWKDIEGYENEYKISTFGNVYSYKSKKILKQGIGTTGYLSFTLRKNGKKKTVKTHRLIAKHFLYEWDEKLCVDHIDGNPLNNNISNLRMATVSENMCNQKLKSNNTTGYKGVCLIKKDNLYQVSIEKNKVRIIKWFKSLIEAVKWYNEKALELHGKFALLNPIPEEDILLE